MKRKLARHPMFRISCQQASRLLSQRQDMPLPLGQRLKLRVHLSVCDACRNVSRQFDTLRLALTRWRERD